MAKKLKHSENHPAALTQATVDDPVLVGPNKTVSINVSKLQAPERQYDADHAWLAFTTRTASLFFCKMGTGNPPVRSKLEIRYPIENLVRIFWKNSIEFHGRVKAFIGTFPPEAPANGPTGLSGLSFEALRTAPSDKEHSEWANFDVMAFAGTESLIDFYALSPGGIARFNQGQGSGGLKVAGVVRVQLTTFELDRLLDQVAAACDSVKSQLPKELTTLDDEKVDRENQEDPADHVVVES